jgi:GGDEF domain-containing protein
MNKPASLLFFDPNEFRQINDTYGHAEGDRAR